MSIDFPDSADELISKSRTDVQNELPESNPFLANSWLSALITATANRNFDWYLQLEGVLADNFPDTSTGESLERWAAIYGIGRLAGAGSNGNIIVSGSVASTVASGVIFVSTDGIEYEVTTGGSVAATNISITTLTRIGNTATAVTATAHNLSANVDVDISGANEIDYNGTGKVITVIDATSFSYPVFNVPATPATGTIVADYDSVPVVVQALESGTNTNQLTNASLTIQVPIAGIDNVAGVDATGLIDGLDQETDDSLRTRLLERLRNPVANFNDSDIIAQAKQVVGVTRVFVFDVTPALGQVEIYPLRDNDATAIPDAGELTTIKDKILEIKPANTSSDDVFVLAATPVSTAYTFTALNPNTPTMQTAVSANLQQFYDEETEVGVDISEQQYNRAIANTIDTTNGDTVISFTLSAPIGTITIAAGALGTLGTITYP